MKERYKSKNVMIIPLMLTLMFAWASSPLASEGPVAKLTDFSGNIILRSQGSWTAQPKVNHPLYSSDKVVTRLGKATIVFNDGAVIHLANNSNLLIKEGSEDKGVLAKTKKVERRLRLILGKMSFSTGSSINKRATTLETPTAVCALRGTEGTLSINAKGGAYESYIKFTEGGASSTVGEFIRGEAPDMPQKLADMNPAQRAAFVAKAAADLALRSEKKGIQNTCGALAAEAAANEAKVQALIMIQNNPDPKVVAEAKKALEKAEQAIKDAEKLRGELLKKGAADCEEPEAYEQERLGISVDDEIHEEPASNY
jgi:hypothetical protein